MKRREFIAGLLAAATSRHARAQQPAKVYRIAFVTVAFPIAEITETRSLGLTPVWWTGEYYRSSDLMWILLVLAVPLFVPPCGARTFVPAHSSDTPARAGPVKIGRRAYVSIRRDISRPHLEGPEHDGSVVCVGISLPRVVALVVDR